MSVLEINKIDKYEILEEIGRGGMGIVYRAKSNSGEEVAVKVCVTDSVDLVKRFKREVRAIQKIHHQNVMPILYANFDSDTPYYVMPETNCQGLFNQIHKKSTKKVPEALYGS